MILLSYKNSVQSEASHLVRERFMSEEWSFYFLFLVNDDSNILFLNLKHQCLHGSFQLLTKSPRLLVDTPRC